MRKGRKGKKLKANSLEKRLITQIQMMIENKRRREKEEFHLVPSTHLHPDHLGPRQNLGPTLAQPNFCSGEGGKTPVVHRKSGRGLVPGWNPDQGKFCTVRIFCVQ